MTACCVPRRVGVSLLSCGVVAFLASCSGPQTRAPAPVTKAVVTLPSAATRAVESTAVGVPQGAIRLPPPAPVRSAHELQQQAARRILAANPHLTYTDRAPEVLLAIPVLAIDLNADGSIRRIDVMRPPRQAKDTIQIAIDAVHRAAPFGDVSHLPRPWRITETFLFNDDRRFKPRTLNIQ